MQRSLSRTGMLSANSNKSRTLLVASLMLGVGTNAHGQWTVTNLNGNAFASEAFVADGRYQYGYFVRGQGYFENAARWDGTSASRVNLTPPSAPLSIIRDVVGNTIVGEARQMPIYFAALWPSTGANASLFRAPGAYHSRIMKTTGTSHVGYSTPDANENRYTADLWSGSPPTHISLAPSGLNHSAAYGISGNTQVGFATTYLTPPYACKWTGSAGTYVNLHPPVEYSSAANDIDGTTIVGRAGLRAAIWTGQDSVWSTLHPFGQDGLSSANAVSGNLIVGFLEIQFNASAILWFGNRNSWVDLGRLMPTGYRNSIAYGISVDETGISVVGSATNNATGKSNAFLWRSTGKLVSGNLVLQNTSATGAAGNEAIDYTITNGINAYTGSVNVNRLGGGAYSFSIPFSAPNGAYTLRFKGGTFLSSSYNVNVSGPYITVEASLRNGDIDQDGEVGPVDFEAVVAQFGDVGNADVDNDGEVGPSDFEIIVANFGLGDE